MRTSSKGPLHGMFNQAIYHGRKKVWAEYKANPDPPRFNKKPLEILIYFEVQLLRKPLTDYLDRSIFAILLNSDIRTCRQILTPGKLPSPDHLLIAVFTQCCRDGYGRPILLHDIIARVGNSTLSVAEQLTGKGVIGNLTTHYPQPISPGKFSNQIIEQNVFKVRLIGLV